MYFIFCPVRGTAIAFELPALSESVAPNIPIKNIEGEKGIHTFSGSLGMIPVKIQNLHLVESPLGSANVQRTTPFSNFFESDFQSVWFRCSARVSQRP